MKTVSYIDNNGYNRVRTIRQSVPNKEAFRGIPSEPPDLSVIDWEEVRKELHNLLLARGLISLENVNHSKILQNSITSVLQPKIVALYLEQNKQEKEILNGTKQ